MYWFKKKNGRLEVGGGLFRTVPKLRVSRL